MSDDAAEVERIVLEPIVETEGRLLFKPDPRDARATAAGPGTSPGAAGDPGVTETFSLEPIVETEGRLLFKRDKEKEKRNEDR